MRRRSVGRIKSPLALIIVYARPRGQGAVQLSEGESLPRCAFRAQPGRRSRGAPARVPVGSSACRTPAFRCTSLCCESPGPPGLAPQPLTDQRTAPEEIFSSEKQGCEQRLFSTDRSSRTPTRSSEIHGICVQRPAAPAAQREGRGPAPLSPPPATPSPSPPSPSPPARRVQGLAPPPEPRLRPPPVLCRGAIPGQHDCAPPRPRRALPRHARARAPGLRRPLRAGIAHAAAAASSISPLIGHTVRPIRCRV